VALSSRAALVGVPIYRCPLRATRFGAGTHRASGRLALRDRETGVERGGRAHRIPHAVSPFQREPSWIGRWIDRVDEANQTRREIESYREWAERTERIWRGQPSSDSFFDREHYVHGVRDAIRGTSAERVEWIAETHANSAEALAHAINVLDTLPTESHAEYEPSGYLATPGSRGGQRLLISGRVGS
jgi:hypothetical protein